ncbi:MAG: 3-deoxy-manno-octulosonate cytidylyltransferase [Deltaproteobacteria bacterium]|nr:3-deoxy-manno-octulosonate cytidylyltransferase [Deltaproteobacteria bacterium]MBW2362561.1 3-deoxy-manno-octulosonate cytidylyltransferase [Deltaproteobacteria bacterium]
MRAVGIIPARYAATRFPGKPLAEISGLPMVQHVWQGARRAKRLCEVLIATDDERIASVCRGFGAEVALTRADHPTGTDRLAEVAATRSEDLVVNIQGDEPLIEGFVIDAVVDALAGAADAPMATVVHAASADALNDTNRVKVVLDRFGNALYFSRSPIPARRPHHPAPRVWQHIGLYAYRREFLAEFVKLAQTPAEQAEGLEQLRALENGHRIRCAVIEGWESTPVDVPADIGAVEARLRAQS